MHFHSFDINHHLYADDTEIYMFLSVSNAKESLEKLQHCLMGVSAWMTGSELKPNLSKTEFHLIGTKRQREKFPQNTYPKHVGHASIISVTCVEFEKVCP